MKTLLCILVSAVCLTGSAFGQQDNKAGTTAAQFLKIGVGARAIGMAEATAGVVDDPTSMYWNVSGLTGVTTPTVTATHTNWFLDISHQYFGLVLPVGDDHRFGVSATVLDAGEIETTTEEAPHGTGDFYEASDVAVGISYAVRLVDFFSFGASVKFISQSIANETASAIGVDLGTTLHTGYKGITIGMAFTNFGTTLKLDGRDLHRTYDPHPNNSANTGVSSYLGTESWDLPVMFRVGIGWELVGADDALLRDESHAVHLAVDARHPNDAPENASVGVEYTWARLLALRGGYFFNDDVRTWSAGGGVHWESAGSFSVGVDYAYAGLDPLGPIHVFTLTMGF